MNECLLLPPFRVGEFVEVTDDFEYQSANRGTPDHRLVILRKFPCEPSEQGDDVPAKPPFQWRDTKDSPVFRYSRFDLTEAKRRWLTDLVVRFDSEEADAERVLRIRDSLLSSATWYPPFVQFGDIQFRVLEGQHRTAAFVKLFPKARYMPVFFVGYADWFSGLPNQFSSQDYLNQIWYSGVEADSAFETYCF